MGGWKGELPSFPTSGHGITGRDIDIDNIDIQTLLPPADRGLPKSYESSTPVAYMTGANIDFADVNHSPMNP